MSITREEIRQLCIAHDRFMAEQASVRIRRPPVSENEDASLIYKDYDNGAPVPAATAEGADWSAWEGWLKAHLAIERDTLAKVIAEFTLQYLTERLVPLDRKLAELEGENRELKGMLGATLTLLGGEKARNYMHTLVPTKSADVVELPNFLTRRRDVG
jgi:hypothetical protein